MAQVGNLGSLRVGMELPIKDWNKNYGKVTSDVKKYPKDTEKSLTRAGKAWEKHAGAIKGASLGMVAFGTATTAALGFAVSAAGDFQQSMVNTQSVVGATKAELGELTGFAREMGKQTVFSAKESADAMYSLGSAGLSTKEIMDSLKGTLNLAAATQSELAFTSKAVAATLSQYGLEADQAGRISNVFTATISASQATMDKLATSMSFVGPVARSIGMSLEETTGILGSLFNAGLDASTAGTALRASISRLLKPTDDAKEVLHRLNVETLDSQGQMRKLTDIIRDLETSGLTAADALRVFGERAGPGMLALVSKGADAIEDLTEKVTGTNKAAEIAAEQVDTFQGQIKILKSAVSELKITIGNQLLPVLTGYATKIAGIITKTSDWANENEGVTSTLVKLGAATGGVALGAGAIGLAAPGLIRAGKALRFLATPVGALAALNVILVGWATKRIWDAATADIDQAASRSRVFEKSQRDLSRAIEDIDIELREYEEKGLLPVDATLGDLNINIGRLNSALGTNFDKTSNAKLAVLSLEKSLERTTKEVNKLGGTFQEVLGPSQETAAAKTKKLAEEMSTLETEVKSASTALLTFPSVMKFRTTEIQREADKQVAIIKQQTKWERDWFTDEEGIVRLGLVQKNVDARLEITDNERKEEQKRREEDRKLRDKDLKEAVTVLGTQAKKVIKIRQDTADESMKIAKDGTVEFAKQQSVVAKIEDKGSLHKKEITDQEIRNGERRGEALDKEVKREEKTLQDRRDNWIKFTDDISAATRGLFTDMLDPGIKNKWSLFWKDLMAIPRQHLSQIFSQQIKSVLFNGGTQGFKTDPQKAVEDFVAPLPKAGNDLTDLSIGANKAIAALSALEFAAFAVSGLRGAGKTRLFEPFNVEQQVISKQMTEKGLLSSNVPALDKMIKDALFAANRKQGGRLFPGQAAYIQQTLTELFYSSRELFTQNLPQLRQARLRQQGLVNGVAPLPEPERFVPRRPEGVDRFGRPLAATPAMAPARGGNVTFGDIIISLPDVTDIRDLDSADWERVLRDNIKPAAEAIGLRFVRNDNMLAS